MTLRGLSYRALNLYAVLFIIVVLGAALYAQVYQAAVPCPLCIMQRLVFIILGILFFIAALFTPRTLIRRIFQAIIFIVTLFGMGLAIRQIYLEFSTTGSVPSCSPSFDFIVQNLPLKDALPLLLKGSGDCAAINWHMLGLTMPEWSLLCFILLAVVSLIQIGRKNIK